MSKASATLSAEAAKASSVAHPPIPTIQRSPEDDTAAASTFMQRSVSALGAGSPQTPPQNFVSTFGQLQGSPSLQTSIMRKLQRSYGNSYMGGVIQAKLTVNQPGDIYEQEADRVADMVMRMPDSEVPGISNGAMGIQRTCATCASGNGLCPQCADEERLQRKPLASTITPLIQREGEGAANHTPQATPQIAANIDALRGGGQPLPQSVQAFFEPRFGNDFGGVRVHTDAQAAQLARAVNARAFTVGRDVVFGGGEYAPESSAGRQLLAHELTHVVQQQSGSVVTRDAPRLNHVSTQIMRDLPNSQNTTSAAPCARFSVQILRDDNQRVCRVQQEGAVRLRPNQRAHVDVRYPQGGSFPSPRRWETSPEGGYSYFPSPGPPSADISFTGPETVLGETHLFRTIEGGRYPGRLTLLTPLYLIGPTTVTQFGRGCRGQLTIEVVNDDLTVAIRSLAHVADSSSLRYYCLSGGAPPQELTAEVTPSGGALHWSLVRGQQKAEFVGPTDQPQVSIRGIAADEGRDDVEVQIGYTLDCRTVIANHIFTVRKLSSIFSFGIEAGPCRRQSYDIRPRPYNLELGVREYGHVWYEVRDQFGDPMSDVRVDERITVCGESIRVNERAQGPDTTDDRGRVCDRLYFQSIRTDRQGICLKYDQDLFAGGCGPLLRNIILFTGENVRVLNGDCAAGSGCP